MAAWALPDARSSHLHRQCPNSQLPLPAIFIQPDAIFRSQIAHFGTIKKPPLPRATASVESVFNTYLELAANANKFGHYKLATRWFKAVIDELQSVESDAPFRVAVLNKMACIYMDNQQYRQAEATYRRALALWHSLPSGQTQLKCGTLMNLAELCILQGKFGQSEQYFRRALSAQKSSVRPDHQQLRQILSRLAYVLVKRNKLSVAYSTLQELEALERQP